MRLEKSYWVRACARASGMPSITTSICDAALGMRLRIEEDLGMPHIVGHRALT